MRRFLYGALVALALLFGAGTARAQTYVRVPVDSYGFCFRLGAPGDQAISASCTITVYDEGTTNLATIYSNDSGGAKVNPFAAATNGTWIFYGVQGNAYDIRVSGGNPAMTPYTISNVNPISGATSFGGFTAGNLSPLFTTSVTNPNSAPALSFSLSNAAASTVFGRCTASLGAPSFCSLVPAMFPAPFNPPNDNGTDLGESATQWRTLYLGTSAVSPVFVSKAANPADAGVLRLGNNEAICAELASPGTDGCITFSTNDDWTFSARLRAPSGTVNLPGYGFSADADTGFFFTGTQITTALNGVSQFSTNGGPGITSSGSICSTTTTRCLNATTLPTSLDPGMAFTGGMVAVQPPLVAGNPATAGWGTPEKGDFYFNTTSNIPRYWNGTVLMDYGLPLYNGTGTLQTASHSAFGSCVLGTSCAVTLTGDSVFTSSSSYVCTALDVTAAAAVRIQYTSGSQFTLTGTGTDTLRWKCDGN